MYLYYQRVGGNEPWTVIQASQDVSSLKPTFITVLSVDSVVTDDMEKAELDKLKYQGPMYFDLDSNDVSDSIAGGRDLVSKLLDNGLTTSDFQIFLSGKKGIHILIPQIVFMDRVAPLQRLPAIYKELAFNLAVDTLDFAVYTARRGRMFRTCHNVRENGNYKVPVTADELQTMTPEGYVQFCAAPRVVDGFSPTYRAKFALLFDAARQKITKQKPKKLKVVGAQQLKRHAPIVQKVMDGQAVDGIGFNKIAIQLALYAREAGLTPDQLVEACAGLLEKHSSDSYRYNTPAKRERELRRMCQYVEDNSTYEYAIEPFVGMLPKAKVVNDDGVESDEEIVGGVIAREGRYWAAGNGETADRLIMDATFSQTAVLHNPKDGAIACLVAKLNLPNGDSRTISIERNDFTSSNALHRLTATHGVSFIGTDIHARGIYEIMLRNIEPNKYVTEREGLDLVCIPASPYPEAHTPFLVWADPKGVRLPPHIANLGIEFQFQGWPDPGGVIRTDLTNAPSLGPWFAEQANKDRMTLALTNLLRCHPADVLAKTIGWMFASFWKPLLQEAYGKFPLLHINGVAGSGKSELVQSLLSLFYYHQEPKMLTPSSSAYAILSTIGATSSIPVAIDEYKPHEMQRDKYNSMKDMFRSAYNAHETSRGGGNRNKDNYGALSTIRLTAPIVFIAEAMETETALLERTVLVTIKRQSSLVASRNYNYFVKFRDNRDVLSILGHAAAANIAKNGSVESLRSEFAQLYEAARVAHLPQTEVQLSDAEVERRENNKERVVYALTVAQFGLNKFCSLLRAIYKDEYDDLFGTRMAELHSKVFARMEDATRSTMPEYIKVLMVMSDMSRLEAGNPYGLVDGGEFMLTEEGGLQLLHFTPRLAYAKYRAWIRSQAQQPLYQNEQAFVHSLYDAPQFVRLGAGTRTLEVDTVVFDYSALMRAGMPGFIGKFAPAPKNR